MRSQQCWKHSASLLDRRYLRTIHSTDASRDYKHTHDLFSPSTPQTDRSRMRISQNSTRYDNEQLMQPGYAITIDAQQPAWPAHARSRRSLFSQYPTNHNDTPAVQWEH